MRDGEIEDLMKQMPAELIVKFPFIKFNMFTH